MTLEPMTVKQAVRLVKEWHRHHPDMEGAMWAISLWDAGRCVGVVAVGRPKAGALQDEENNGRRLELVRCAVLESARNACSMLYGAAARAARAMGAWEMFTYTSADEPGTSLKAAGWVRDTNEDGTPAVFGGGQWGRKGRPRKIRVNDGPRHRWWTPWSKRLVLSDGPLFSQNPKSTNGEGK